ncbi:MAG: hypothetical protein LBB72_00190 [Spirochaetaceae bacterium]|jgi:hypothetical protein|nr:hypothetical protein [Spirochaetaceae bacterium]
MAPKMDFNAGLLLLLLNDYFPGLVFFTKNNSGNIGIANYVVQKQGAWTLDIYALSKSKEKIFSSLFPQNISCWDEAEARKRYGCADIIRFFIDTENDAFSAGFSKSGDAAKGRGKSIPIRFFDELDYSGKPVWEDWNFSSLVLHKMRRRPPCIYEAFCYYARRHYTLMGFGLGLEVNADDELLKSGTRLLNDAIREQIPETANFGIDRLTAFFELTHEILESVPAGGSVYNPARLDIFINHLKIQMVNLSKNSCFGEDKKTYSASDRKTINNHIEKAEKCSTNTETLSKLRKVKLCGTYREKINLLHRIVFTMPMAKQYSQKERDIIHSIFLKQHKVLSLDKVYSNSENNDAFSGYDLVGDEKYVSAEDHFAWSSFFRNEFAKELDKDALEKFIECLPNHFSKNPFDINSDGLLTISKYSRKILFTTFCSTAGIAADNELWGPFLVLLKKVVDNINKSKK